MDNFTKQINNIVDYIIKALEKAINMKLENLEHNREQIGTIQNISGNKVVVNINDLDVTIGYLEGLNLSIGDVVKINIPNNDYSSRYVFGKLKK